MAFKNCKPFRKCRTEINETFVDDAKHINIVMPMYNLIEHSDNYSDTSGSLWQFKRDETEGNVDLTVGHNHIPNNLPSFMYKSSFTTNKNGVKIVVPLKYLSNFWKSLEMPLIKCKVEFSLTWDPNCLLSNLVGNSSFTITVVKLYVPVVILSTEDNTKLLKLLTERFKRPVYWNKYKIIPNKIFDKNYNVRELLDSSYQGVKRLFVLAYRDQGGANRVTADSPRRYFLPRVKTENYNIEIDDYTTGCLLDFACF